MHAFDITCTLVICRISMLTSYHARVGCRVGLICQHHCKLENLRFVICYVKKVYVYACLKMFSYKLFYKNKCGYDKTWENLGYFFDGFADVEWLKKQLFQAETARYIALLIFNQSSS